MPSISVAIANHNDNQHTLDEDLRIQNLWDGIELNGGSVDNVSGCHFGNKPLFQSLNPPSQLVESRHTGQLRVACGKQ